MIDDYKYVEAKSKQLGLIEFKIKLLESQSQGYIVPELILEMLNNQIDYYAKI